MYRRRRQLSLVNVVQADTVVERRQPVVAGHLPVARGVLVDVLGAEAKNGRFDVSFVGQRERRIVDRSAFAQWTFPTANEGLEFQYRSFSNHSKGTRSHLVELEALRCLATLRATREVATEFTRDDPRIVRLDLVHDRLWHRISSLSLRKNGNSWPWNVHGERFTVDEDDKGAG